MDCFTALAHIRDTKETSPDAGPRPSQLIKNEISLATYSDLDAKVSSGTLVEPLWLKDSPEPAKKRPKTGPRASQILKNEVPEATWSDFGAKTPFGILFGPPLAPTWRHKEAPKPSKGSQNKAKRKPKRLPNETKSLLKIDTKFNIVSDIILEQKSIENLPKI